MRTRLIPILTFLILLFLNSAISAKGIGVSLSYGGWTLSPFTTLVEKESEAMIRNEFSHLMDPILPPYILFDSQIDVNFSKSSGQFLSCRIWLEISRKLSMALQGDLIHFRMPFHLYAEQEFTFDNFVLARQITEGNGSLEIKSVMLSLAAGLKLIKLKNLEVLLTGGVAAIPFNGNFDLTGRVTYSTLLGSVTFKEEENTSINNLRTIIDDIPAIIISPTVGVSFYYRLFKSGGITLNTTLSHGFSYALGGYFLL